MRARILQLARDSLLFSGMAEPEVQAGPQREAGSQGQAEPQLQSEQSLPDSTLVEDQGAGDKSSRRKSKTRAHRPIVESLHIRTMIASYKHHIAVYSKDREQVNQLIPSAVWKGVYAYYIKQFPNSPFVEETLKDRLRETIKEIQSGKYVDDVEPEKTSLQNSEVVARLKDRLRETLKELRNGTFNEEDFEKAVLQSDEVFQDFEKASLKTSLRPDEEHATRNLLKRKLSSMEGTTPVPVQSRNPLEGGVTPNSYSMPGPYASNVMLAPRNSHMGGYRPIAPAPPPAPAPNYMQPGPYGPGVMLGPRNSVEGAYAPASNCMQPGSLAPSATSGPSSMPSPHLSSTSPPTEKVMSKDEMLQQQSRSIAAIATQFLSNSEKRDALLAAEMAYHRAKSDFYNEKTRKLKIGNLKLLKDEGVISEEEFKQQVKLI
ncbi:hypothetical protein M758_9G130600 [Ceratodon purpureus]|nr:hypothetical protein M758_9G130600 [Ceratodon purpureus]